MDEKPTILKLQKEIERLKKSIKKQRYGLVWMDIPEAFEDDVENKLPILKEVPELAIKNNDGKPTHILIEGDNYHALTCLNYTHKGKIDVIYIDPPYNTGSDGFRYKDKRIIDKFPDGTEVPIDHPFKHSYWLSFMRKRLELARDVLKGEGVIFISIDDNEVSQLRLLCDEIFGENNFMANIIWQHSIQPKGYLNKFSVHHNYILCYRKMKDFELSAFERTEEHNKNYSNPDNDPKGPWRSGDVRNALYRPNLIFDIKTPSGKIIKSPKNGWRWSKETINEKIKTGEIIFNKDETKIIHKIYLSNVRGRAPETIWFGKDVGTTREATRELKEIFGGEAPFETPKPVRLIKHILRLVNNKKAIVLDYFAGSGTTAHAVLDINKKDGGKRKFILCTNNENNICTKVCYPRIKKVIKGYKNKGEKVEGLGNSLKYYKTAFIGKNNILNATDEDKVELAHNAGELLAIAENTLELVRQNKYHQLFEDGNKEGYTAVYFREELDKFEEFVEMVEKLKKKAAVYVFSWGDEEFNNDFDHIKEIRVKTIPKPILEIYKNIYNLGA